MATLPILIQTLGLLCQAPATRLQTKWHIQLLWGSRGFIGLYICFDLFVVLLSSSLAFLLISVQSKLCQISQLYIFCDLICQYLLVILVLQFTSIPIHTQSEVSGQPDPSAAFRMRHFILNYLVCDTLKETGDMIL